MMQKNKSEVERLNLFGNCLQLQKHTYPFRSTGKMPQRGYHKRRLMLRWRERGGKKNLTQPKFVCEFEQKKFRILGIKGMRVYNPEDQRRHLQTVPKHNVGCTRLITPPVTFPTFHQAKCMICYNFSLLSSHISYIQKT